MCEFCEKERIIEFDNSEFYLDDDNCINVKILGNHRKQTYLTIYYCPSVVEN